MKYSITFIFFIVSAVMAAQSVFSNTRIIYNEKVKAKGLGDSKGGEKLLIVLETKQDSLYWIECFDGKKINEKCIFYRPYFLKQEGDSLRIYYKNSAEKNAQHVQYAIVKDTIKTLDEFKFKKGDFVNGFSLYIGESVQKVFKKSYDCYVFNRYSFDLYNSCSSLDSYWLLEEEFLEKKSLIPLKKNIYKYYYKENRKEKIGELIIKKMMPM